MMKNQLINQTGGKITVGKQEIAPNGSVCLHSSFVTKEALDETAKKFKCSVKTDKKTGIITFKSELTDAEIREQLVTEIKSLNGDKEPKKTATIAELKEELSKLKG